MQTLFFIVCVLLALADAGEVSFSPERGFYSSPFKLTLELPKKLQGGTAQIKYVVYNTDPQGPSPSANGGLLYTQPITISASCYVISAAFDKGQIVTDMVTHTFIFPRDILTDTSVAFTPARLTALGANGSTKVLSGLLSLPTVALTSDFAYPYPAVSYGCIPCMADNERATRFEWIDPAHPKDHLFYFDASFDIFGTSSRGYNKKNLKINFNSGALKYDFFNDYNFGPHAAKRFKELAFRAHSQDGPFGYNVYFPLYLKNLFQEYTQQDANQLCSHGRMVHIYFNSKYQGIYHMREKLSNTNYFGEYFGGEDEDYEGIGGDKWSYGGRMTPEEKALFTTWNEMHTTPTWTVLSKYVDWDQWCTFAIIQSYTCNADLGYLHNIQLGGPKKPKTWNGPNSGWRYQPSGPDSSWYMSGLNENSDCVGYGNIDLFNNVWSERHPDFVIKFQDHIFKMLEKPGATLSYAQSKERFERMIAMFNLDDSVALELYRWGFDRWGVAEWRDNIARVVGTWIVNRAATLLSQYAARTMTNAHGGVLFNLADRAIVPARTNLTISPQKTGAGCVVQYTTNGQDPRLPGGAIHGQATKLALGGSITLTEPVVINARLQCAPSGWGPINTVQLNVLPTTKDTCAMCKNVIFTEFSYNPDKNESSFVEIKNIGSKPLVMTGATIKGMWNYTFPSLTLAPGQFWVVGHKLLAFYQVYKKNADDYHIYHYDRKLSSKKFTLTDQFGNTVHEFTFSDSRPWSEFADGAGFTLVANPQSYKDIAENAAKSKKWHFQFWRYSSALLGSPWQDDPTPKDRQKLALQFSFVSYFSKTQWVELYNPTLGDIDISGWILTNDLYDDADDYTLPKGTVVKAMQKLKIKDDKFNFKLKQAKDVALLETRTWKGESLVTGQAVWFNAEDNSLAF